MTHATELVCSCCGIALLDTPAQNALHGVEPYPADKGCGMCPPCAKWSEDTFFEARFKRLLEDLNPANSEKFNAMPLAKKKAVVATMIEKGHMV